MTTNTYIIGIADVCGVAINFDAVVTSFASNPLRGRPFADAPRRIRGRTSREITVYPAVVSDSSAPIVLSRKVKEGGILVSYFRAHAMGHIVRTSPVSSGIPFTYIHGLLSMNVRSLSSADGIGHHQRKKKEHFVHDHRSRSHSLVFLQFYLFSFFFRVNSASLSLSLKKTQRKDHLFLYVVQNVTNVHKKHAHPSIYIHTHTHTHSITNTENTTTISQQQCTHDGRK